jgi:hypothetical protein
MRIPEKRLEGGESSKCKLKPESGEFVAKAKRVEGWNGW